VIEAIMSLLIIDTVLILLGLGALIGLCRRVGLREVMHLLGGSLLPFSGRTRPVRRR
jgi:hypothetical protein